MLHIDEKGSLEKEYNSQADIISRANPGTEYKQHEMNQNNNFTY